MFGFHRRWPTSYPIEGRSIFYKQSKRRYVHMTWEVPQEVKVTVKINVTVQSASLPPWRHKCPGTGEGRAKLPTGLKSLLTCLISSTWNLHILLWSSRLNCELCYLVSLGPAAGNTWPSPLWQLMASLWRVHRQGPARESLLAKKWVWKSNLNSEGGISWPILMTLNSPMRNSIVNNLLILCKTFLISCPGNHTAVIFLFPSVVKKNNK